MLSQKKSTSAFNLPVGSQIIGKWNKQTYTILRLLGKGAIGAVYLVKNRDGQFAALKISDQIASISSEVNVLKKLTKVHGSTPGPSLFDTDDWISRSGQSYPFYTMEYVHGERLDQFISSKGIDWLAVLLCQLLSELEKLHQLGFVLGDLKIDNLIVTKSPIRLRFIDVGGVTSFGRSVKEYTDFYDRGYWKFGDRKAEPKYDLFSLAMVAIHCVYPNQFKKTDQPRRQLLNKLKQSKSLANYQLFLERALLGKYKSCFEMKRDLEKYHLRRMQRRQPNQSLANYDNQVSWIEIVILSMISLITGLISYLF
ncbi:protein kinase domain-containing protein [Amphibacillus xylanus]|uniref:protein kinase domain-containing protein n=1 Tax=Amphibacillus xylanus TaxID=1449 RepID=UPI0003049E73|nr:serine/threonine protein kinase [Amphibacillus xylanus]